MTAHHQITKVLLSAALLSSILAKSPCQTRGTSIGGTISEARSGEAVIGVNVMLVTDTSGSQSASSLRGSTTNKFGFYSLTNVPPGIYRFVVRGIGYRTHEQNLQIVGTEPEIRLDIALVVQEVVGPEVVVLGSRDLESLNPVQTVDVDVAFSKHMPALGGESDLFRTLQLLPGVKAISEVSSGLYIRGGSADQNLILLDGVTVYNPFHLGGFLSTFNSDALQDVRLIKGGFPAQFGGRLSSVIDVTMKEGTKEKFSGSGAINLINSRLTLEGPISKDVTFMVSGRRMYLDLILLLAGVKDALKYYFYDLNAKTNVKLSESDRVYISGYFGRDVAAPPSDESGNFDISWGNSTANVRWMHIASSSLFTNFSAIISDFSFSASASEGGNNSQQFEAISRIRDYTIKGELQWSLAEQHLVRTGGEVTYHGFRVSAQSYFEGSNRSANLSDFGSVDISTFAQDEWMIGPDLLLNFGGRAMYFDNGKYLRAEPRVSATYRATDAFTITASAAQVHQFLHLLVRNDLSIPTDIWFPSNTTVGPSTAIQGTLGCEYVFPDNEYQISSEMYYKDMKNLYEYKDRAEFSFGVPLESQLTSGKGVAYGVEVFFEKKMGDLTGWIGYTLAWTKETFAELNSGMTFYPRYDRRHDIGIAATYPISQGWDFGASWVYGTGQAYTMPTGLYYFDSPIAGSGTSIRPNYSLRNAYRLPAFHKLDINLIRKFTWFGLPFEFSMSVYNVYDRRNAFAQQMELTYQYDPSTRMVTAYPRVRQFTLFPMVPTIGLSFKF